MRAKYASRSRSSAISVAELRVAAEEIVVVEGEAAPRFHVALDAREREDAIAELRDARMHAKSAGRGAWKCISQPGGDLRHGQVDVGATVADHPAAARGIAFDHPLEISEVLGQSAREEFLRAPPRLGLLVLVVERR